MAGSEMKIARMDNFRFSFLEMSLMGFIMRPMRIMRKMFICDSRLKCEIMQAIKTIKSLMCVKLLPYLRTPRAIMWMRNSMRKISVDRESR